MGNINWHNVRMYGLIVLVFITTGLGAIKGMTGVGSGIDALLTFLLGIEHTVAGNTNN